MRPLRGRDVSRFYSVARGLSAPGPLTYFSRPRKVGKSGLKPTV